MPTVAAGDLVGGPAEPDAEADTEPDTESAPEV